MRGRRREGERMTRNRRIEIWRITLVTHLQKEEEEEEGGERGERKDHATRENRQAQFILLYA